MRVRAFELRLIGVALVVCWSIAAGLVLLAYRPGGPLDLLVGLLALAPIGIALAGVIWPPVARGDVAFPAIVWLGILALLCLVPSITGVVNQLLAFGSRTLLPSFEAAYPWLLALFATSLFSGFGIARRLEGGTAIRRRRLIAGTTIAVGADPPVRDRVRSGGRGQRRRPPRPTGGGVAVRADHRQRTATSL